MQVSIRRRLTNLDTSAEYSLRLARAELLQKGRAMTVVGSLFTPTATWLVLWLWFELDPWLLSAWYASNYLVLGTFIVILALNFPRDISTLNARQLRQWDYLGVTFSFISGAIWGVAAWLFIESGELELLLFLVAIFLGNGMGAMPMLCPYYPAFVAFILPTFIPFSARLLMDDSASVQVIGLLMGVYLGLLLYFGRVLSQFITRAITTDIENEQLLAEVTKINLQKSRFLAWLSHDLRQPLAAIGLFLGGIERGKLDPASRNALESIDGAWSSLDDMCQSLLEISRLDAGVLEPAILHHELTPLLTRLQKEYGPAASHKGIKLIIDVGDEVVCTDIVLLERVLTNLLSNAIKYTDTGHIRISVCTVGEHRSEVQINIIDTGCGIPEEELDAVFNEYYQVTPTGAGQHKGPGLGLGLAVVSQLCTLLAHKLEVHSRLAEGTTFSVTLPVGNRAELVAPPVLTEQISLSGLHVAVVDDDDTICQAMQALLKRSGAQVTTAHDSDQLLEVLDSGGQPPDLVICDYHLDSETGPDVIARARAVFDPELPAVLMTADASLSIRKEAAGGGLYLLYKPIKIPHLLNVIGDLVWTKHSNQ